MGEMNGFFRSMTSLTQRGFTLIEVLVTFLIVTVGLLGLAALQVNTINDQFEAYQRAQVTLLVDDMADRIRVSAQSAKDGLYSATPASPYGKQSTSTDCTAFTEVYKRDLCEWNEILVGVSKQEGSTSVGAPLGAVGCIETRAGQGVGDTVLRVSVAWQGMTESAAPAVTLSCGAGLYGSEAFRRVIFRDVVVR